MKKILFRKANVLLVLAVVASLFAGSLQANAYSAATVVRPGSLNDWVAWDDNQTGTGHVDFVAGPGTAPLGGGSVRMVVDDTGRWNIGTAAFAGTRLDQLTNLQYSTYSVTNTQVLAITLQLDIDYDDSDTNTSWQGRLVFEPYLTGTVEAGKWQTWSPLLGKWYSSGEPGKSICPMSAPCTFAQVLAQWPNAAIRKDIGNLQFKAGGPWTGGFTGAADALTVGVSGTDTTFDFEPADTVLVDDDWAAVPYGQDPDGTGPATAMGLDASATIQGGVNLVANQGTVKVAEGLYTEQVKIDHPLTLTGAGIGKTIVKAPAAADLVAETRVFASGTRNIKYIIGAFDANGVTVQDLSVNGDRQNTCAAGITTAAVAMIDSSGSLLNARLYDVAAPDDAFGCQSGAWQGVLAASANANGADTVTVKNVTVDLFQKNGISAWTDAPGGLTVDIEGNSVLSAPTALTAQNGIQVSSGATGVIKNNLVKDVFYTGTYWTATSILVFNASTMEVSGNQLPGGQASIYVMNSPVIISNNVITTALPSGYTEGYWGIIVTDPPSAKPSPMEGAALRSNLQANSQSALASLEIVVKENIVTGGGDSAASIGIEADAGYDANDSNVIFLRNRISKWGIGINTTECTTDCTGSKFTGLTAHFNHFDDNLVGFKNDSTMQVLAENNWWGCNAGPGDAAGLCDTVVGDVVYDPWLVLTLATDVQHVMPSTPATLVASLTENSAGVDTSSLGTVLDGLPVVFTTEKGLLSKTSVSLTGGKATVTLSADPDENLSNTLVTALYDDQMVSLDLVIGMAKLFMPAVYK